MINEDNINIFFAWNFTVIIAYKSQCLGPTPGAKYFLR